MKDPWEQECATLRAEVAALQQQVHALVAQQANAKTFTHWRLSKSMRLVLLPVIALLAVGGVLYGQGAMEALFIDQSGNVGVGTTTPQGFQIVLPEANKPYAPKAGITLAGGLNGNASIEVRNNGEGTPYIDFAQKTGVDYDARLRLTAPGKLAIEGASLEVNGDIKATNITLSGVSIASIQNAVMPVGTIMAYGGDTSNRNVVEQLRSQGWLPCDGATVSRTDYAELFAALGTAFGAGDARTTFHVPDLRGRFLRGTNKGTGRDPDAMSRRAEPNGGNTGDMVGSVQDDDFKQHTHTYDHFPAAQGGIASGNYWRNGEGTTGASGGKETRPKNVYVNWIIKAKHLPIPQS
jgi:rhizosphere induced protein